jgi:Ca-activated chloride channel family protein
VPHGPALTLGVSSPVDAGDDRAVAAHYRDQVIRGPGAFVKSAQGYTDYEAAMGRKLLRELEGMPLSLPDQ